MNTVFISHSSTDHELAAELCRDLEGRGIVCWLAPRDEIPGTSYAEGCIRGIESTSAFLLLASAAAISSTQVLSEVEQAHKRKKNIYTVLIGKPQVSKELDYYISRLHWIEYAGNSADSLAAKLAKVLVGDASWSDQASPPSLRRTVLYRRDAFVGSALATLVILAVAGFGLIYWLNHRLDMDFRRLGYASVAAQPIVRQDGGPAEALEAQVNVWLMAEGIRFSDVRLLTAVQHFDGSVERSDRSNWRIPEQVGSVQQVEFALPLTSNRLTTCLIVPAAGLRMRYRITQEFVVSAVASGGQQRVGLSPVVEPKVSKEDGRSCSPTQ